MIAAFGDSCKGLSRSSATSARLGSPQATVLTAPLVRPALGVSGLKRVRDDRGSAGTLLVDAMLRGLISFLVHLAFDIGLMTVTLG
jgi:hypothetical protein